ncbi:MAG: D-alanyl-D-alanine carboxypeptidase, partial [Clostridiales bacterium]|nr:D-alanyl-D-alanine carboxypeptidase [Clostridiales bacterium]
MKKAAFLLSVLMIFSICFGGLGASAAYKPPTEPNAQSILVANLDADTVVYEKNSDQKMYPASLTKIMTCLLALENTEDLDAVNIPVNRSAFDDLGIGYSNAGLTVGETLSMRDLLYCLMLNSACESANVIAEAVSGSVTDFVAKMNARAAELGMTSTHFENAHGLPNENQYTTARDLYKLAVYCKDLPIFMEICSSTRYNIEETAQHNAHYLYTTNLMMESNTGARYYDSRVKGIKTGYTPAAGRCLVSTASSDGYSYLCIVMGAPTEDANGNSYADNLAFVDTGNLYDWVFSTFRYKTLLDTSEPIDEVKINLASGKDNLLVVPKEDFKSLVPSEIEASSLLIVPDLPEEVTAPVKQGDVIGTAQLMLYGESIGTIDLVASETIERDTFLYLISIV